ncbi:hypothetical protein [Acidipropionibacterium jensenii]|uniref:Uncharacterized protein n=1 Tax=Acidipropionibacterium jensenii TaxID=1749 RepID=A0A3S4VI12_9ACTN|nr:hypothetical protein [Acidipropionibacterium jensenii]VEI02466.1 Uncharacterised protein [Acidipropionibacterium jensenii]
MSIVPLLAGTPTWVVAVVVLVVLFGALLAVRGIGKARPHS